MQLQLPKPLHGWRVFAGEVGVIVLGVLLALGAQQAAEGLQWKNETEATQAALEEEIMDSVEVANERLAVSPCLRNRIAQLGSKLARSDGYWRADPMRLGPVKPQNATVLPLTYRTPRKYLRTDAWDNAKTSGVLNHMPRERAAAYSAIYTQITHMEQLSDIERGEVPALAFLSFDGPLDGQARERAINTLAQLDSINLHLAIGGSNLAQSAKDLGLQFSPVQRREVQELYRMLRLRHGNCVSPPD